MELMDLVPGYSAMKARTQGGYTKDPNVGGGTIHSSFPSQGVPAGSHEGSQSQAPSKDQNDEKDELSLPPTKKTYN